MVKKRTVMQQQGGVGSGRSMAPKLSRFGNPVSGSILFAIMVMIVGGLALILLGSGWGIPVVVIGVGTYFVGETRLEKKPVTAGVLYFWGRPLLDSHGQAYVVGGTTFSFNFWPFYLELVQVDMTSKERTYTFEVTTRNDVTLHANVVLIGTPNKDDMIDLIQVGGTLEKAFDQIKGTLSVGLQALVGLEDDGTLAQKGDKLREIGERLKAQVEQGSFGITVNKLSLDFDQPNEVKSAMQASRIEEYYRDAEEKDLDTAMGLAKKMLQEFKVADPNSRVTLQECLNTVIGMLRASRSGNVTAFAQQGGGGRGRRNRGGVPVVAVVNQQPKP